MTRTLLVSSYTPARGSGRGVRTYGLARALAAHGPVDLLYSRFDRPEPAAEFRAIDGLTLHEAVPGRGPRRALAYARARVAGVPAPVARGVSGEVARVAAGLAARADRVVADDPMAAATLAGLARRRPVIYSAQNLESAFRSDWGSRGRVEAFERAVISRSAETWMPTAAELEGAARLVPGATLRLVPNVVDVAAIAPVDGGRPSATALFVADFTYAPNREALAFLLEDVLPRAWERVPGLRLNVVGRGLDAAAPDPRVHFRGFVDDLSAVYAESTCAVVPLLRGGGSPLKLVEALAYGLPVVATPRAAAGLGLRAGEHYLAGDDADGFAGALVAALDRDRAAAIGAAGRALAQREHSIESLVPKVAPREDT